MPRQIIHWIIFSILAIASTSQGADQNPFANQTTNRYIVSIPATSGQTNQDLFAKIAHLTTFLSANIDAVPCATTSKIVNLIPSSGQRSYLGDVVVEVTGNCVETRDALLKQWRDIGLRVFTDGNVGPNPYVSGNN